VKKVKKLPRGHLSKIGGVAILILQEAAMPQMTLKEKLAIGMQSIELEKQGKIEESIRVQKQIPLAPYLAKFAKEKMGVAFLLNEGWNLSEAEEEYGSDWLSK
jgi:hypothetical protein